MTKIYPQGQEAVAESTPLTINKTKRDGMIAKAKDLLDKPMEFGELKDALEQYYITEKNEHYTSKQLKEIISQVQTDLAPEVEVVEGI